MKLSYILLAVSITFNTLALAQELKPAGETLYLYGRSYYAEKNCERAIKYLKLAEEENYTRPDLYYMMGMCYYRAGNYTSAISYLLKSSEYPKLAQASFYYAGRAFYKKGDIEKARDFFSRVVQINPHNIFGNNARKLIEKIKKVIIRKFYSFSGVVGVEYDTNVPVLPRTYEKQLRQNGNNFQKEGLRETARINAGISHSFLKNLRVSGKIDFYQSVHNLSELRDYDLTSATGDAEFSYSIPLDGIALKPGVRYSYSRDLLGYHDYFQGHNITSFLSTLWRKNIYTSIYYTYRFDDFYNLFERGSPRDANVNSFGATLVYIPLKKLIFFADINYEHNSAYSNDYKYNGINPSISIKYTAPYLIKIQATASYIFRDYTKHPLDRRDNLQLYSLSLGKTFSKYFYGGISYTFTKNNTREDFAYERQIISVEFRGII